MKAFQEYWTFSAIRGALTLGAAAIILALPYATSSVLEIPFFLGLAVDCLAAYTILDAAWTILLTAELPSSPSKSRLYGLAIARAITGILLFFAVYGVFGTGAMLVIAAVQAVLATLSEVTIARQTYRQYGCASCYTAALVMALAALALPLAGRFSLDTIALALAAYIGAYGLAEIASGGRMLFLAYRSEHPAREFSQAWREELTPRTPLAFPAHKATTMQRAAHAA